VRVAGKTILFGGDLGRYGRGGKLIIPSFAIGRVEEVLHWLKRLEEEKRIPALPVYVDSPMAIGALQFYSARLNELDPELSAGRSAGMKHVSVFATTRMTTIASRQPSIVIASSDMATGGRVLRHLAATISNPKNLARKTSSCSGASTRWPRASSASTPCRRTRTTARPCGGSPGSRAHRA
jgi:metallo-beta-lactamase family protein